MSVYKHGVYINEQASSVANPSELEGGVPIIIGTAPINQVAYTDDERSTLVGAPILCNSLAEAKEKLGYASADIRNVGDYTLCEAMDVFFKVHGIAPFVAINVLGSDSHKVDFTEDITVTEGQAIAKTIGIITDDGLEVKTGDTVLASGTDYTYVWSSDGNLVIVLLSNGISSITVSGKAYDCSKVSVDDVLLNGVNKIDAVYPRLQTIPSYIIAPHYSRDSSVALALANACTEINGSYRAMTVIALPNESADSVEAAVEYKKNSSLNSANMIVLWPQYVSVSDAIYDYTTMFVAMSSKLDYNNDNVPNLYPSNKTLGCDGAMTYDASFGRYIPIEIDNVSGNELNAEGIVTVINQEGYRVWGNNTACYSMSDPSFDPKDRWIGCRRFFTWWGNNFIKNNITKVDSNANIQLIQSIVDAENIRGNAIVADGKAAAVRIEYREEDNTNEDILNGKLTFRQYLSPYTPAEQIVNTLEFDTDALMAELNGGE